MKPSLLVPVIFIAILVSASHCIAQSTPKAHKANKPVSTVSTENVGPTIEHINTETVQPGKDGKQKNVTSIAKAGTEKIILKSSPATSKPSTGITRTMSKGSLQYTGINQAVLTAGYKDLSARQKALTDLQAMGCTLIAGNPAGVFCKTVAQFNKAFDYLKKGNIDDVQGDLSDPNPTFKTKETLDNSGVFTVTGTPTLYINKNGATPKVTGKASFTLKYSVPVLGNAPGCDPNNKALTDNQYHRKLIDQQNYFVDYRNYGLFSFSTSTTKNGSMSMSFDVTEADIIRAINYANSHNSWGQTFYMTMTAKAGPTFIFPDPVCTQSSSGLLGINKEYTVVDHGQLIRPYKIVSIQLKVISSN
ncbi:MAG TPA: hypothetical protein VLJ68_05690 [Chitinophagaceae bacterium]|nr:hypothetical protein [Chitinophagaceae bacterium]